LAKSFALRDAPKSVTGSSKKSNHKVYNSKSRPSVANAKSKTRDADWEETHDGDAERRMREIVRAQGRLSKKGGIMMSTGASEFQIPAGTALEKMVALRN
jgi:ATP-dependent RNA helicase DDX31/DBP7